MTKIRHYINGQDFGEPRNWQDLEITVDWLNKKDDANINITDLEFVLEAKDYLMKRILNGTTGHKVGTPSVSTSQSIDATGWNERGGSANQ